MSITTTHTIKKQNSFPYGKTVCSMVMLLLLSYTPYVFAGTSATVPQDSVSADGSNTDPEESAYDEILVYVNVQSVGGTEIPSIIKGSTVYLSVGDIFDFLRIKNDFSYNLDTISGFFIDANAPFIIDAKDHQISYANKTFTLGADELFLSRTTMYLQADYFGEIFGLNCTFDFRSLSVFIKSQTELPVVREMRLAQMHANLDLMEGVFVADSTVGRSRPLFHFGNADWALNASQQSDGINYTRANLNLGSLFAGGELNALLSYTLNEDFAERDQYYLWRYVTNSNVLSQVMAGKIGYTSISTIYDPVVGFQLSNRPATSRRSFGRYTISDYTEPGWMVELYVNNVLIDYAKADVSGFYTFNVPLIYGTSEIMTRYYGPWGEVETSVKTINIPFTFLPANKLEYNVSGGMVEDSMQSVFTQARLDYGLARSLTVGAGYEYLSSVSGSSGIPFLNASMRLPGGVLLNSEYAYGVRSKTILNYRLQNDLQFELNYTKYAQPQESVLNAYTEERKASASMPFHFKRIYAFSKLSLNQDLVDDVKFNNADLLLSVSTKGVNLNVTTYTYFMEETEPYVYSNISLSMMVAKGIILMPKVRYLYGENDIIAMSMRMEAHVFRKGSVFASYEKDMTDNAVFFQAGFKYDLPFSHVAVTAGKSNDIAIYTQSASGSMIHDQKGKDFSFSANPNINKGGIILLAFLDLNGNGRRDKNEPKVKGLDVRSATGAFKQYRKDTTIVITGLEAYTNYCATLNTDNFENIGWMVVHKSICIAVDPNMLKLVEIPVKVVGEASGTVYLKENGRQKGIGPVTVEFYAQDSTLAASVLSEPDGYFNYLGLAPGDYTVKIEAAELDKLHMSATEQTFTIERNADGDVADDLVIVMEQN